MFRNRSAAEKRSVVCTSWDDGSPLDCDLSKLLKKYEIQATFYVPLACALSEQIDDNELRKLARHFEIGAHSLSHQSLDKIPLREARAEIVGGKNYLSNILGRQIEVFCYPSGRYTPAVVDLVKESGFIGARTTQSFRVQRPADFYEMWTTIKACTLSIRRITGSIMHSKSFLNSREISILLKNARSSWVDLAKAYFNYIHKNGGVFHIWGHSWEIERFGLWDELEKVFDHIAAHDNVEYLTNGELIKALQTTRRFTESGRN